MSSPHKLPEVGDNVVGKVVRVDKFGAYISLEEYEGLEAFVHVSEITLKWVRNIRNYLREGQREVFKVIRVNPKGPQVDLSLRRVSQREKREKELEWNRKQKVKRIMTLFKERAKVGDDYVKSTLIEPLESKGVDIYDTLADLAEGSLPSETLNMEAETLSILKEIVTQEIKRKKVTIKGTLILQSREKNGAEVIRRAVALGLRNVPNNAKVSITVIGPPRYMIRVETDDVEKGDEVLRNVANSCINIVKEAGGKGELVKE